VSERGDRARLVLETRDGRRIESPTFAQKLERKSLSEIDVLDVENDAHAAAAENCTHQIFVRKELADDGLRGLI